MGGAVPESCAPLIGELDSETPAEQQQQQASPATRKQLCPYAAVGECRYGVNCAYLHGDVCDLCGLQALHPTELSQRSQHTKVAPPPSPSPRLEEAHRGAVSCSSPIGDVPDDVIVCPSPSRRALKPMRRTWRSPSRCSAVKT